MIAQITLVLIFWGFLLFDFLFWWGLMFWGFGRGMGVVGFWGSRDGFGFGGFCFFFCKVVKQEESKQRNSQSKGQHVSRKRNMKGT